jgi:hypothetical protein
MNRRTKRARGFQNTTICSGALLAMAQRARAVHQSRPKRTECDGRQRRGTCRKAQTHSLRYSYRTPRGLQIDGNVSPSRANPSPDTVSEPCAANISLSGWTGPGRFVEPVDCLHGKLQLTQRADVGYGKCLGERFPLQELNLRQLSCHHQCISFNNILLCISMRGPRVWKDTSESADNRSPLCQHSQHGLTDSI